MTPRAASPSSPSSRVVSVLGACAKKDPPTVPPVPVMVGTAEHRAVPYELAATGMVEPIQTVAVQPQVSGPIVRIAFREGQDVKKGQVLFELDPAAVPGRAQAGPGPPRPRPRHGRSNAEEQAKRYAALAEKEYVTAEQNDAARSDCGGRDGAPWPRARPRWTRRGSTSSTPPSGRRSPAARAASASARATWSARPTRLPLVTINQIQPILARFAVPASNLRRDPALPDDKITVFASPDRRGQRQRGHAGVRRQRGRHHHRARSCSRPASPTPTARSGRASSSTCGSGSTSIRTRWWSRPRRWSPGQQGSFVFVIQPDSSAATTKPVKVEPHRRRRLAS